MTNFVTLDDFDHRLLARVRLNNLEPARVTAEAVGLSESAVLRRLRRLRAEGVIAGDVAVIDPARVEPRIVLHVLVEMDTQDRKVVDAFQRAMKASPEVQGCWDVTGETDYLVTVARLQEHDRDPRGRRLRSGACGAGALEHEPRSRLNQALAGRRLDHDHRADAG